MMGTERKGEISWASDASEGGEAPVFGANRSRPAQCSFEEMEHSWYCLSGPKTDIHVALLKAPRSSQGVSPMAAKTESLSSIFVRIRT